MDDRRAHFSKVKRVAAMLAQSGPCQWRPGPFNRCEKFAIFFSNKITSTRAAIIICAASNGRAIISQNLLEFTTFSDQTLYKLVSQGKSRCCLDPVPNTFFKNWFDGMPHSVRKIIYTFLETGYFTESFKTAAINPLLEKNKPTDVLNNSNGVQIINQTQLFFIGSHKPKRLGATASLL